MATILICAYPLEGAVNATRKLARDLRERGHLVHYFGFAECRRYLPGESFYPLFENVRLDGSAGDRVPNRPSLLQRVRRLRAASRQARRLVVALCNGSYQGFDLLIHTVKPDMIIIESSTFCAVLWGLLAYRFRIPTLLLNDCLTAPENPEIPPVTCDSCPRPGAIGRMLTRFEWKRVALERGLRDFIAKIVYGWDTVGFTKQLAKAFDYPVDLIEEHEKYFLRVKAPEIILMPASFDFPNSGKCDRYYSAASVDLDRQEIPFPWERLNPALPIVFCSLGTQTRYGRTRYRQFFERVIQAFESFSDRYQLVIATCNRCSMDGLGDGVPNVLAVQHAPQIAVLRRTALMITHGGANSIRECMTLGVPMLMFPIYFDQFGNAARAVAHGVALRADFCRSSSRSIRALLQRLLTQPYYRLQTQRMKYDFHLAEKTRSAAECVESFLDSASSNR
jgi:MGT family glycosyltransferase